MIHSTLPLGKRASLIPVIILMMTVLFQQINAAQVPPETFAWQQSDYIAPNFDEFFPDDPRGGEKLDALWNDREKDFKDDEVILTTVHQGLRQSKNNRSWILRWIGNKYIWGKNPQNPYAIEIMYHAMDGEKYGTVHYANYFGMSVTNNKTPNILRSLVMHCINTDDVTNEIGRVSWGCKSQKEELIAQLEPFKNDPDKIISEKANMLEAYFQGDESQLRDHLYQKHLKQAQDKNGEFLDEYREKLKSGNSEQRMMVLAKFRQDNMGMLVDDSWIPAFIAAGTDEEAEVRRLVARIAGNQWVWTKKKNQSKEIINLMLELSHDEDRDVRHKAVYFGLSTIWEPSDQVLDRLVEMALEDEELSTGGHFGRLCWALKRQKDETRKRLNTYMDNVEENPILARNAFDRYEDICEEKPPLSEKISKLDPTTQHMSCGYIGYTGDLGVEEQSEILRDLLIKKLHLYHDVVLLRSSRTEHNGYLLALKKTEDRLAFEEALKDEPDFAFQYQGLIIPSHLDKPGFEAVHPFTGEEGPFTVTGIITDENDEPLPGVEIRANAGMGTLMPTGSTTSDKQGRYTLKFGPGMFSLSENGDRNTPYQCAILHASHPDKYEENLCRHASFAIASSGEKPTWGSERFLLTPDQVHELNFKMVPGATLAGWVIKDDIDDIKLGLYGEEQYPATSIMSGIDLNDQGFFTIQNLPLKPYYIKGKIDSTDHKFPSINFDQPGTYRILIKKQNRQWEMEIINQPNTR